MNYNFLYRKPILPFKWPKPAIFRILPIIYLVSMSCNSTDEGAFKALKGHFRQSIIETGELRAVNASTMTMPRINSVYSYTFKILNLAEHGKNVKKGEPVISLDPSSVQKYIIERRESLENEIASANKQKVQITSSMQDLKAQLKNEQAQFDIKKLERDKSAFESIGKRRVIELEYKQAELRLNKLKRKIELKPKLDSLDYQIMQIRVRQRENELKSAIETLDQLTICSPLDGIFVVDRNPRTGQIIKAGDEIYLGYAIAKIPNIEQMKVSGFIQENDISKVRLGLDVIVRLDALPGVPFHGKISKINKVCIPGDQKKVFPAEVLILETDPRLKPGMTVSCEFIVFESEEELYVPIECLLEENHRHYLFVKKSGNIRKVEVNAGPSNNLYAVVKGDIKPGQHLILPENILTKQK